MLNKYQQVIIRDVVVEVVGFHSVAPTSILGAGLTRNPLIAAELRNLRTPLPWKFKAKWIADTSDGNFRSFEAERIHVTEPSWDGYRFKLSVPD